MLDETMYWPAASGPFRAGGEGWHWHAARMEAHYRAKLTSRQLRWMRKHFLGLDGLAYSMAHFREPTAGVHWRFDGGRKVRGTASPFTIYHVESAHDGTVLGNIVYDGHGHAVIQVDFARHDDQRSGHWHPLVPGSFFHLDHCAWDTCPILWQLVPRTIGRLHTDLGR